MRLIALLMFLLLNSGCERQMPTGIPPRDATLSELSSFDGRWQLAPSNPDDEPLPFDIVTISGNGQRVTVDHPDAVVGAISGEYLNSGVSQFVDLTVSVAVGSEEYELTIRRPEEPDVWMSGWMSGDGIVGRMLLRVDPAQP